MEISARRWQTYYAQRIDALVQAGIQKEAKGERFLVNYADDL